MSPEMQSRLQALIEQAVAEVLANDRDTMQRQFETMVHEYQAGYRDHRLWVQGRQEADARWLAAITEQQQRVTRGGASWQHLEAVVRRVTGGQSSQYSPTTYHPDPLRRSRSGPVVQPLTHDCDGM